MRVSLLAALLTAVTPAAASELVPVFERDVLPIFSSYCFTCHGKSSPEMGIDLRTARSVLRGGFDGPVIRKGAPQESLLYRKVSAKEMPPPAFKNPVPEDGVELIRQWIAGGALSETTGAVPEAAQEQIAHFRARIQPLLTERCTSCHGGGEPQAGLNLESLEGALRGSVHGPVLIEGSSDKSILIRQLVSGAMPPQGAAKALDNQEIDLLRNWIDAGQFADWVELHDPADSAGTLAEAPPITTEDRAHWAFRVPQPHEPPKVRDRARIQTPIDRFIVHRLEEEGLGLSTPASKRTLLRRAYFDLWGLPPSPEEAAAYLADTSPGAFERLIDRLLESPRYGQRWGRFWLDAAGYVDTSGKDFVPENASLAPGMWRYRDYVIDAFNSDKPWDRFLTEQLAGDELVDWRDASEYTPETLESLVATGFLRTVLDATNEDISNRPADRYDTLFALIDKLARSTVGLTLTCARCHDHKYDPISQRDYYRFLALFSPAYNPSAWIQPKKRLAYTVPAAEKGRVDRHNEEIAQEVGKLTDRLRALRSPYVERLRAEKLEQVPEVVRNDLREALTRDQEEQSEVQAYLVRKFGPAVEVSDSEVDSAASPADRDELARLQEEISAWKGFRSELHPIQALWDGETTPVIRLLQRGSVEAPGPRVRPGFLDVLCPEGDPCLATPSPRRTGSTSGYRLALAEWLTSPGNPLTARVAVNRIWQHHFGTGIVATADNFGRQGSAPSHPGLLDWLASDFVRNGWKVKRLHKLIMLSSVYQQSSRRTGNPGSALAETVDPANRLLWRRPLRRLEAEALRDSILAVAGRLDTALRGPPVLLDPRPDGLQVPFTDGATRRSVYLLARRNWSSTFLTAFDYPNMDTTCIDRTPSSTPLQSLTVLNSQFVLENAEALADRVLAEAGDRHSSLIQGIYRLALAREPTATELGLARDLLQQARGLHVRANRDAGEAERQSAASLAHMLISTNEFLYID